MKIAFEHLIVIVFRFIFQILSRQLSGIRENLAGA